MPNYYKLLQIHWLEKEIMKLAQKLSNEKIDKV